MSNKKFQPVIIKGGKSEPEKPQILTYDEKRNILKKHLDEHIVLLSVILEVPLDYKIALKEENYESTIKKLQQKQNQNNLKNLMYTIIGNVYLLHVLVGNEYLGDSLTTEEITKSVNLENNETFKHFTSSIKNNLLYIKECAINSEGFNKIFNSVDEVDENCKYISDVIDSVSQHKFDYKVEEAIYKTIGKVESKLPIWSEELNRKDVKVSNTIPNTHRDFYTDLTNILYNDMVKAKCSPNTFMVAKNELLGTFFYNDTIENKYKVEVLSSKKYDEVILELELGAINEVEKRPMLPVPIYNGVDKKYIKHINVFEPLKVADLGMTKEEYLDYLEKRKSISQSLIEMSITEMTTILNLCHKFNFDDILGYGRILEYLQKINDSIEYLYQYTHMLELMELQLNYIDVVGKDIHDMFIKLDLKNIYRLEKDLDIRTL